VHTTADNIDEALVIRHTAEKPRSSPDTPAAARWSSGRSTPSRRRPSGKALRI